MKRRVVVTGIGVVTSIGTSIEEFWSSCLAGKTTVEKIPAQWSAYSDFNSTIWSPLPPIDYTGRGIARSWRLQHDPVSLNALLAAREAADNAGWSMATERKGASVEPASTEPGIYMGTGIGGAHTFMENHLHSVSARARKRLETMLDDGALDPEQQRAITEVAEQLHHPRRIHPFMVSMLMPNAVAAALGIYFASRGPNRTYCLACASGTTAIGEAFRAVRDGTVDTALAGGSEYFQDHHGYLFRAFDVAGTLVQNCEDPHTANRPFDQQRSGFLFGQGASGMLALESLEGALARGAPIITEVSGYAESFDAYSMMALPPEGEQLESMIRSSIGDAGLQPGDIDYINAHGTGTAKNDTIEADMLRRVFGKAPLINSTKSLVGHTFGASGALEAAVLALSLNRQTTHPSANLENPVADLNFVTSVRDYTLNCGISQSFAFGGHNAALVMQRFAGD